MKIVQMCRSMGAGGIEAIVCGLSNELSKNNEVTVCTLRQPNKEDLFYNRLSPAVNKETLGKMEDTSPVKVVFQVFNYIRKSDADIIHIHGFFYFYLLAILFLHRKKHFFYTIHSDALKENNPWDLRLLKIKRLCFRKAWIHPVTISPASKDSFTRLYGCESKLIPNGIPQPFISEADPVAPYRITEKARVFISAGRICQEKRQGMLCSVFKKLITDGADVSLLIAGPNHDKASFEMIKPFLSDRIIYLGERTDIPSLMHYSDGMCLSSEYEGMPVVILEALSVGCPCICTPVGGIVNMIISGKNGVLSESTNEEDYYTAMTQYLSLPPGVIESMKELAEESFQAYDVKIMAKNYYKYYLSLQ